jgi:predicted TIM-barrel fold metal-dependent hydrolase
MKMNGSNLNIIDPHVHLFDIENGIYTWLKNDKPPFWPQKYLINRSYVDRDLYLADPFYLAAYVHIEAGFDNEHGERELAMLESKASIPMRSIGYIDITLAHEDFLYALRKQSECRSSRGIRYILEGSVNEIKALLENDNSYKNLSFLGKHNGIFELQLDVKNTELVVLVYAFFNRLPELQVVLNHAGKAPLLAKEESDQASIYAHQLDFMNWQANLLLLAKLPKAAVKCSGFEMSLLKEDKDGIGSAIHYTTEDIIAVVSHCIDAFGSNNVMMASNFPLCMFSMSYQDYWETVLAALQLMCKDKTKGQSEALISEVLHHNAKRIYGIES